jgi:hypothetical protein
MAKQCIGKHIVQKRKCTQRKTIFIFQKLSPNLSKIVKGQKRSLELESSELHKCKKPWPKQANVFAASQRRILSNVKIAKVIFDLLT